MHGELTSVLYATYLARFGNEDIAAALTAMTISMIFAEEFRLHLAAQSAGRTDHETPQYT